MKRDVRPVTVRRIGPGLLGVSLSLSLGACGDDTAGPAPGKFDELCGQEGPVRLLALDPDEVPQAAFARVLGDRYLLTLPIERGDADPVVEVWSVGRCGEDPLVLADDVSRLPHFYEPWPEIPFACRASTGALEALDPTGVQASNPVFETRECFHLPTSYGVVTILGNGDTGPLVLQPWPDDPFTGAADQVVLADEVKSTALPSPHLQPTEYEVLDARADEVFAITAADELVVVTLDDLALGVIAQGVREMSVGPSGRWVIWQGVDVTNEDPDWPEGPIFLTDRESGETTHVADTALAYTFEPMMLESLGLIHYRVGVTGPAPADFWLRLDTLESYEVPGALQPLGIIDETWPVLGPYFGTPYYALDVDTGQLTTLYEGSWRQTWVGEQGLTVLSEQGGELVRVARPGESKILAPEASDGVVIASDEHVITPYEVNGDGIGSLIIVDPDTHDERYIDDDVLDLSVSLYEEVEGELEVSYAVVDSDPDRHGIWLARPAG
jgi:hypothetical protein